MSRKTEPIDTHTKGTTVLRGFTTITFFVDDVPKAVDWYRKLLGIEPYFAQPSIEEPAYVEFRIGDHEDELGLIDSRYRPSGHEAASPAGAVTYWHVDDVRASVERLLQLGATEIEPPTARSEEWVTAYVADPFGNILGLMHSPHYLEVLGKSS